jgi:DNA-binding GntR family transcriptional regulator
MGIKVHDQSSDQDVPVTVINRETVADKSAALLRDRIISGELRPGTAVTEEALAEELGVSRSTVRQALNTLMLEGLLTRRTTRVLQVATLTSDDVRDIYRARRFLELGGVEAAANASAEDLARITNTVDDLKKSVVDNDVAAFVQADARCHAAVVALLGSQHLIAAHAHLMVKLQLVITAADHDQNQELLTEHLAVHKEFARLLVSRSIPEARANLAARLDAAERAVLSQVTDVPS